MISISRWVEQANAVLKWFLPNLFSISSPGFLILVQTGKDKISARWRKSYFHYFIFALACSNLSKHGWLYCCLTNDYKHWCGWSKHTLAVKSGPSLCPEKNVFFKLLAANSLPWGSAIFNDIHRGVKLIVMGCWVCCCCWYNWPRNSPEIFVGLRLH